MQISIDALISDLVHAEKFFKAGTAVLDDGDARFAPAPGMFTVTEQIAHTAQTLDWFREGAFRPAGFDMNFAQHRERLAAAANLASARTWLSRSFQDLIGHIRESGQTAMARPLPAGPILGGQPRAAIVGAIVDHTAHHRGSLAVYIRLRGKVPPMPYG
jgi:uncharacterized damage-inducible protein DinB